jgi:hypothetical protein
MSRQPKRELLEKLTFLLEQRYGGKEAYTRRARELNKRGRISEIHDIDADWLTNFSAMNTTSMKLIVEALESSKVPNPDWNADKSKLNIDALKNVKFSKPDPRSMRY